MSMISAQCDELRELAGDGSMEWTSNGPCWYGTEHELNDELYVARQYETETHKLWVEYMGDDDEAKEL